MSYNLSVSDFVPEMVSTETTDYHLLCFDLPLYDSSDYNLQALLNSNESQQNPVDHQSTCQDQLVSGLFPPSPPTDQLESLSLYQTTQFQSLSFGPNLDDGYVNFNGLNDLEVKNEECQLDYFDSVCETNGAANKYLQRSFSSNCVDGKPEFSFQPHFDSLMESQNFQDHAFSLPENSFLTGQIRKVCSAGDLENMRNVHTNQRSNSIPSALEGSFTEDLPLKVGRYNPEERQERISKYRAKRNQRNFNKTIKYACRKTLADNRPRIRGRFARNDETVEIPKAAGSTRDEDEDELWALHEIEDATMAARGNCMSSFVSTQAQYEYHQHHHGYF